MGHVIAVESAMVLPSSDEKTNTELSSLTILCCKSRFQDWETLCSKPRRRQGLKRLWAQCKRLCNNNKSIHTETGLWKMTDWLLSDWKAVTEIEVRSSNSISIRYCNSISLLSPLTPGLLQAGISFFPLNSTLISDIRKRTYSCNRWCHAIVLSEDQKYPPCTSTRIIGIALPSIRQWMFLLHLHSTWTVNLTSSHNNGKHFQQFSELIYSDPYRANFEKEKCINLQLRIA